MPPLRNPATIPSLPRATARTAFESVTMENTISDRSATARGVSAQRMPDLISASALSRDLFQPVTSCPAAMRRGTISCPMAPSPTKPSCTKRVSLRHARASRASTSFTLTLNTKDVDGRHKAGRDRKFYRSGQRGGLRQLVVALAEAGKAHREPNSFLRRLEDNEGCRLADAQLLDQLVIHDDFGDAAVRQAPHKTGAADVRLVDLQAKARRQQYAERCDHAHQPAFLIGGLEHDHGEADIGAVFGGDALDQRALLGLGARRRIAADLPVFMHRLYGTLRSSGVRGRQCENRDQRYWSKPPARAGTRMPVMLGKSHRKVLWHPACQPFLSGRVSESSPGRHVICSRWVMPG